MERSASERALQAAVEIYSRWEAERERTPIDRVVSAEFRSRRYLNSGERRRVSAVVYGSVRYRRRQHWLLERLGLPADPANVIRLWAAAPTEPELQPMFSAVDPLAASPEAIAAALGELPGTDQPDDYIRITLSFPDDMADALSAQLGIEAPEAARALNAQAPTTLRLNPLRVGREHLRRALPDATLTRYSPWGLELPRRVNISDLPGYRTGWFEVQEEASQLAALLMDPLPGQTVVEIGAGAGGKTLALAALMDNRGALLAIDTHAGRLEELTRRAERAGVTCVETAQVGADEDGIWQPSASVRRTINRLWAQADCVLVDAPCTGSGVLRRNPDAKWRQMEHADMHRLQRSLMAQAAMLTAPGGHLFYVTCSFERDQNEAVIESFLDTEIGKQFALEPIADRLTAAWARATELALLPPSLRSPRSGRVSHHDESAAVADIATPTAPALDELTEGPFLRTWPHRHGLDAFFAACLRRSAIS